MGEKHSPPSRDLAEILGNLQKDVVVSAASSARGTAVNCSSPKTFSWKKVPGSEQRYREWGLAAKRAGNEEAGSLHPLPYMESSQSTCCPLLRSN